MARILLFGDSLRNPNIYYRTGFLAPDPVVFVEIDDVATLAVPAMEQSRARNESRIANIVSFADLGYNDALQRTGDPVEAQSAMIQSLSNGSDEPFQVEADFPLLLADKLRAAGLHVTPVVDLIDRRTKSGEEVEALARAQARAEQAISEAVAILREALIVENSLVYRGVPLTAERIRGELDASFVRDNFVTEAMIVAPGPGSSDPHWSGSGLIRPNEPIVLDIFPQDRASRFYGDVTRTYVKGEPTDEVVRMFEAVRAAQATALEMIKPGVNGKDVHEAVRQSFADSGYGDDGPRSARYIHGTGHGLGLEVHELPRLGRVDDILLEGDVVTVEPGLYDPAIGGVRLEDVVVLTADGIRNLNKLPKDLKIA